MANEAPLGLIAGSGRFPLLALQEARRQSLDIRTVAHKRVSLAAIEQECSVCCWLRVGQLKELINFFHKNGVTEILLAGGIPWNPIRVRPRFDMSSLALLARNFSGDDRLLRALSATLEEHELRVIAPRWLTEPFMVNSGHLAGPPLCPAMEKLIDRALTAAITAGERDRGQAAVARGDTIYLENRRGTDALLKRVSRFPGHGGVFAKAVKPQQDHRFDLPTVGPATITAAKRAGLEAVVVQAKTTLLIDRSEVLATAARLGISLIAVHRSTVSAESDTLGRL